MSVSNEEYDALVNELSAKQTRRSVLDGEIRDLADTIQKIEFAKRGLPTEPGMYFHPDENWPAVLSDTGVWTDGWGNQFDEHDSSDLEHVKRVKFVE